MKQPSVAILHYTAPPVVGGVEAVIQAHVEVLASNGHRVRVIAGRGDESGYPEGADFQLIPEINSQHPQVLKLNKQLERGVVPTHFSPMVDRLVEGIKPHLHGFDRLIAHNILTKHFNLALTGAIQMLLDEGVVGGCIAWCHDFTWTSPSSRSKVHPGNPWDLLRTKWDGVKYVVVSKERREVLAGLFECPAEEISVIYNGVDPHMLLGLTEAGKILVDRLALLKSDLILLMPVRVTKAKNIEFALRVLKAIQSNGLKSRLIVTGPPDPHAADNIAYYHSLLKLREELGLEGDMHYVYELGSNGEEGYTIDITTVSDLIRVSDLVFLPSHREGFGMPVLEAGMLGVPVFASEIPAVSEIAKNDVTLIDTSSSPEGVAGQILEWARGSLPQFRRKVRQTFTWEAIYQNEILPLLMTDRS